MRRALVRFLLSVLMNSVLEEDAYGYRQLSRVIIVVGYQLHYKNFIYLKNQSNFQVVCIPSLELVPSVLPYPFVV